jgi:UDP-glucose 4-epimerase
MNRKNETLLVTGGAGLLGLHLVSLLANEMKASRIVVIDRSEKSVRFKTNRKITVIRGDLKSPKIWERVPENLTAVFHLAAFIPRDDKEKNSVTTAEENLLPLELLIEYSRRWPGLEQVVYSSSVSVYANSGFFLREGSLKRPSDIYGASKLAGESLLLCLESRGVRVASLRYSSLYGYGQYQSTVLPVMVNHALSRNKITVYGDGARTQDFLHYSDAATANVLAYNKRAQGAFNVGTGKPVMMSELAEAVNKIFRGGKAKIVYLPKERDYDSGLRLDIKKAARELRYHPSVFLEDGLRMLKKEMGAS